MVSDGQLYVFMCLLMIVIAINAQRFGYNNYYPSNKYRAASGSDFG